jgi:hypothetical protein
MRTSPNWGYAWLLSLVLVVASIGVWEYALRERDYLPSVDDSHELWSWYRSQIGGAHSLVLLGTSRMLLDIDMAALRARYPGSRVLQLGVNGLFPLAALKDLAGDESFHGLAIVSFYAQALEPFAREMQKDYPDFYHQRSAFNNRLNKRIGAELQERWVSLHPLLRLQTLLDFKVRHGRLPDPFYVRTLADRSFVGDYQLVDSKILRDHFVNGKEENYREHPPTPAISLLNQAQEMGEWIGKIQKRGGQVILLRLPTTGRHWDLDEKFYPRARYWDPIVASTSAFALHFHDVPGMDVFDFPDTSHLDHRDSQTFTTLLFDYMEQQWPGVFEGYYRE